VDPQHPAQRLGALLAASGWPARLSHYGVGRPGLPALAAGSGSPERAWNNPVRLDRPGVLAAIEEAR